MTFEWWEAVVAVAGALVTVVAGVVLFAVHRVPKLQLRGARVLVTGGSTGIGLDLAKTFARKGAHVVISARREDVLKAAVAEINSEVRHDATTSLLHEAQYVVMDVSNDANVAEGCAKALELLGGATSLDIVVCCAGFSHPSRFLDCPASVARQMMEVNYFGCVNVSRQVLPSMIEAKHGRIVLVSSMAAAAPVAGFTTYAASKAAVRAFAQSLDMEYACLGVRTQVVNPPDVATPGYELENAVKSEECKQICAMGGASPFTARQMAEACVDGMEHYSFQVNLGFDGRMLGFGSACMEPPASALELMGQFLFGGMIRLVGVVYTKLHYGIVKRVRRAEAAKNQSNK
jgi:3-dehydrosphinganine reductase